MWLNFPAASILWRETLHMNADMNTRMSNLVGENEVRHRQILSFQNWERNQHVLNMNPCFHWILYNTATTYGYCHRIHISPTIKKLINHSNQRNHQDLRIRHLFAGPKTSKPLKLTSWVRHCGYSKTPSQNTRNNEHLSEQDWNPNSVV